MPCAASLTAAPLQDNTLVARAPGNPLAVQVFEERDRVFASDAGQLFENWDGDALALRFLEDRKAVAELRQRVAMKNQLGLDPHQGLFTPHTLHHLLAPHCFHSQLS